MEMLTKGHWTPMHALQEADRIIKEVEPVGQQLHQSETQHGLPHVLVLCTIDRPAGCKECWQIAQAQLLLSYSAGPTMAARSYKSSCKTRDDVLPR